MDEGKPKGFGEFDKLARKLVQVPPRELPADEYVPIMKAPRKCIDCGKPSGRNMRCGRCAWKAAAK